MSNSVPQSPFASGASTPPASGHGSWEFDLLSGTAWFSDWFYQRLQWPTQVKRRRLTDLRPHLPAGVWDTLLLEIRAHLERQMPLDARIRVQVAVGPLECWRVLGSVERNAFGKPAYLRGSMREVGAEQCPDP